MSCRTIWSMTVPLAGRSAAWPFDRWAGNERARQGRRALGGRGRGGGQLRLAALCGGRREGRVGGRPDRCPSDVLRAVPFFIVVNTCSRRRRRPLVACLGVAGDGRVPVVRIVRTACRGALLLVRGEQRRSATDVRRGVVAQRTGVRPVSSAAVAAVCSASSAASFFTSDRPAAPRRPAGHHVGGDVGQVHGAVSTGGAVSALVRLPGRLLVGHGQQGDVPKGPGTQSAACANSCCSVVSWAGSSCVAGHRRDGYRARHHQGRRAASTTGLRRRRVCGEMPE